MMNVFRKILPLMLASSVSIPLLADNITSKAWMLKDERQVNNAKAYDIFRPVNSLPFWKNIRPMTGPVAVSIWFPVASEVRVSGVRCQSRYESFKATMQTWQDGRWSEIGTAKRIFFRPKSPVNTHLLRFILRDISNKDHDCLGLLNWRIDGSASGKALYDPADMSLSCDAKDNTFDLGTVAKLKVSVADKTGLVRKFKLTASLMSYQGKIVIPENAIKSFSLNKGSVRDSSLTFKHDTQGPYFVTVFLYDEITGILLAAKRILIGFRDPAMFEEGKVDEFISGYDGKIMPISERIAENGTIFSADATQSVSSRGRQPGDAFFNKIKSVDGEILMSFLRYSDFEPLPGVYNFEYFDHMVRKAGKYDLGLEAGLWWWDFSGPTQYWLKNERIRQRDGTTGKGKKGIFSVHSRKFSKHAKRATELFIKRYRNCPEIWFWHPHAYGGVDHDGEGIYDFHPDALQDWAEYLQKKYVSINNLNKAYGSKYKSWKDVPVPAPLYEKFDKQKDFKSMVNVVDTRPQWVDWLDFYHRGLLNFRIDMMKLVRKYDKKRGISGVNATGGVGKADLTYAKLKEYNAFYGDQGLNLLHYVRRLVAKRRYGLSLRHEDIAPVTIGRRGLTKETAVDRANWDIFQICLLGASHFNYVFTAWTNSPFWDLAFANPRARKLVKESNKAKLVMRPVGYMHSFTTDRFTSKYNYQNIPVARWWLMNGFSDAMLLPGNFFEMFSDGCDLKDLKKMKVVIDDGSTVMTKKAEDALVDYVKEGGKLILFVTSGQRTLGSEGEYNLLHRLGYKDTASLLKRHHDSAMLVLSAKNTVFGRTTAFPLNKIAALEVPKGGTILGRVKTDIGAVLWPFGKGQVVLIGGVPGSVTEDQIQELWSGKTREEKKKAGPLWSSSERELGAVTAAITRDAAEWAGVKPQFSLPDRFRSCLKREGDKTLVYMYNNGPAESAVLRVPGLSGKLSLTAETLTDKKDLGEIESDKLASPGISLPELGRYRFMVIRIQPVK